MTDHSAVSGSSPTTGPEHLDVLIVGAGISGVGTAYHLQSSHPSRSYAILEARQSMGGTWDLFRYPGIRSDSDLPTFAYKWRPWTGDKALADGQEILDYVHETARENGIDKRVRFGHRVISAAFDSATARWTVEVDRGGEIDTLTCTWLFGASGYYRYDEGYTPQFEGVERFTGAGRTVVHPQQWPEDLDYSDKRVVVIGSGATAVTLVPAMSSGADAAEHVTMLQRSPSYVMTIPSRDVIANAIRRLLGERTAHRIARAKNVWLQRTIFRQSRKRPGFVRRMIRASQKRQLPRDFDLDTHFNPSYDPWDQRLCMVPDGDLFKTISRGDASVVTDRIETFTETGLRLESGRELEADIIVTATGLNLLAFGGIDFTVDGQEIDVADTTAYKGMMLSGVPNFAFAIGYTNASWTLKVDLVGEYFARLLGYMDDAGWAVCNPVVGSDVELRPLLDFDAGYVQRSLSRFPTQGDRGPWQLTMDYSKDVPLFTEQPIADGALRFSEAGAAGSEGGRVAGDDPVEVATGGQGAEGGAPVAA
ncbi:MAG TPA: NAD(P)/FAD-dependent oxidoreductase [Solirubrobacterales bacterium]|nr:NAD(P)/FAD-dependent oxidoreductase [Solirubrobacterales bacterium]